MTHQLAALILDFGGVLTTDLWASIRACSRRAGLHDDALIDLLSTDPEIHPLFIGLERGEVRQPEFETRLAAAAGTSSDHLLERMCADLKPDQAMLRAVAMLRASGVRVGILSNSWGTGYFNPYKGYDLEHRTDAIIISDQVHLRKPEPAIFNLMLEMLRVEPQDAVFIDDVADHLANAAAMGLTVIHHVRTSKTLDELGALFAADLRPVTQPE